MVWDFDCYVQLCKTNLAIGPTNLYEHFFSPAQIIFMSLH